MNFSPKIQLEISWDSLFKIFIFGILVYVLFLIREILVWFFLALIISILFNPAINFFTKRKIPRTLSAIFVYFVFFSFLFFVFYYISLPLLSEIQKFGQTFPENFGKISPFLNKLGIISFETFQELTQNLQNWLLKSSKNIAGAISVLFGSFFATLSIISLAIFLSIEEEPLEKIFPFYFGKKADWFLEIWKEIKEVTAKWFGARVFSCFLVGILTYIALVALKIPYPLSLSILCGFANFVPILGPIFSGFILVLVAFIYSLKQAILVLILFVIIQQIEGNLISPILINKFLNLPPYLVLLSLLIGGKLMGITGAILFLPLFGAIFNFSKKIYLH